MAGNVILVVRKADFGADAGAVGGLGRKNKGFLKMLFFRREPTAGQEFPVQRADPYAPVGSSVRTSSSMPPRMV